MMRTQSLHAGFDFDCWAELARHDPQGFEAARRARLDGLVEALVSELPAERRRRLRGLQFRLDMERRRAATPMAACVRIQSMMWDSVLGPDGLVERVNALADCARGPRHADHETAPHCATILPFSPRRPN